jgi:hypothetical protein
MTTKKTTLVLPVKSTTPTTARTITRLTMPPKSEPVAPPAPVLLKGVPAQRTFTITLHKKAAYRLRDFCDLFNVSAEDALAAFAGEEIECLDDCREFELSMGKLTVAFRHERERTALTESQLGRVHP